MITCLVGRFGVEAETNYYLIQSNAKLSDKVASEVSQKARNTLDMFIRLLPLFLLLFCMVRFSRDFLFFF